MFGTRFLTASASTRHTINRPVPVESGAATAACTAQHAPHLLVLVRLYTKIPTLRAAPRPVGRTRGLLNLEGLSPADDTPADLDLVGSTLRFLAARTLKTLPSHRGGQRQVP